MGWADDSVRLPELMAIKGRSDGKRITYDEILVQTGVAKTAMTKLAKERAATVGMSVMNRLCDYFDCQPGP